MALFLSRPGQGALSGLSFPAALVDSGGAVKEVSAEWAQAYPEVGPGTRLAAWWAANHPAGGDIAADLANILASGSGAAAREYAAGEELRRVMIAAYPGGALVSEHPLGPGSAVDPRAQKMEAIGRLAGGVAHDFANLLTLIAGYSEMLLGRVGTKDPTRPDMEEIRSAAERGARLTSQLLTFLRGEAAQPQSLDLNAIIRDMQGMLRPIIGERIAIETELGPDLDPVSADAGQMEQMLLNLILNARDAMPEGGRITIETCNYEMGEALAVAHGVRPGRYAMLSISDTGAGIAPESLARVFEPFFTTKEEKGTGLGLSTVYGIVKRLGGDIWATSLPGEGAAFTLCLPSVTGSPAGRVADDPVHGGGQTATGTETVLLVEDEESVRSVLAKVLRRQGYQVLEACDGIEALEVFGARGAEIALVLTDVVMPRLNGRELNGEIQKMRPGQRVILMSGYSNTGPERSGDMDGVLAFLEKPLRPEVLAAKVREALDSPMQPFNPS